MDVIPFQNFPPDSVVFCFFFGLKYTIYIVHHIDLFISEFGLFRV